jgi:hypothetical protein
MFIDVRSFDHPILVLYLWSVQLDILVNQQDDTINAIETSAAQVNKDTEAGCVPCFIATKFPFELES